MSNLLVPAYIKGLVTLVRRSMFGYFISRSGRKRGASSHFLVKLKSKETMKKDRKINLEETRIMLDTIELQLQLIGGILSRLRIDDEGRVLISKADSKLLSEIKNKLND